MLSENMTPIELLTTFMFFLRFLYNVHCSEDPHKSDNINQYLFHEQRFQFEDLTLPLNKQFHALSDDEKDKLRSRFEYNQMVSMASLRSIADSDSTTEIDTCENEWIGTSVDVRHKGEGGPNRLVTDISNNHLILPLIIADISSQVSGDPNFVLHKHHLDFFLNNYFGKIEQPCIILFKFGWSKFKSDGQKYFGLGETAGNDTLRFPGISGEVAIWITTAYKNIVGVGVDSPTVDPGSEANHVAHNALVDAGLYVVENVDLDRFLPDAFCTALMFPLKNTAGRSPVRFMGICPKNRMELPERTPWHRL